jgi:predicted metal-dependent enzyme (double-stranded beta helix superfamily)
MPQHEAGLALGRAQTNWRWAASWVRILPTKSREDAMAQDLVYELDQFIADCRANLARDPGPAGREQVRQDLERLLKNDDFVRRYCGDEQPHGVKVLYEDPALGFQVLAHTYNKARISPPHDHGASWAIYGQATKYTDMIEWAREDDGSDAKHAKLKPVKKYRLNPGMAGIYQDGTIHSIDYPDFTRFVRVTGTDLDKIPRIKIDLKTGAVEQMYTQAAV